MSRATLLTMIGLSLSALVSAQVTGTFPATPLASKRFAYPTGIPYQVDTDTQLVRGPQHGYNICNSTTEGPTSDCQTSWVNSVDDFCLWAPSTPNSVIGNVEGETIAWCTKPGHGTRLIPAGALKGVQFIKTPAYVQVVGFIDQTKIDIQGGDFGGEMDPHGADLRGNPLGGILYSNAFSTNGGVDQIIEWTNFLGSDTFCIKACTSTNPNAGHFCEHIYDRIGCFYNMPNTAANGTFESCLGENQDYPGVYTDAAGVVQTYKQPGEGTEPTPDATYTPRVPASSSCTPYTSSVLFAALPTGTGASTTSGTSTPGASTSRPNGGSSSTPSNTASGVLPSGSNNASVRSSVANMGWLAAVLLPFLW